MEMRPVDEKQWSPPVGCGQFGGFLRLRCEGIHIREGGGVNNQVVARPLVAFVCASSFPGDGGKGQGHW